MDARSSLNGARARAQTIGRALLGVLVGIGVATVAGYLLGVQPREALRHVAGVPLWAVAACVASGFVNLALQSLRWHSIMRPLLGLSYGQAYRAQIVGMMFNAILPARGGDLLRVQYLGRRTGKSRATILGTEIVDRWLDWWGWIPTYLVLLVVSNPASWMWKALLVFGGLLAAMGTAMFVISRRRHVPSAESRWGKVFGALQTGIRAFRQPRTWLIAFLIAPLPWLWEAIVLSITASAFGIELSLTGAFSVLIGFNIAMVVPSPGAIGTVETGGTAALVLLGADQSAALAFIFVYHFCQLLPGIMGGVAVLVAEGEKLFGSGAVESPGHREQLGAEAEQASELGRAG